MAKFSHLPSVTENPEKGERKKDDRKELQG
jgi:hypothetical protein